MSSAANYQFSAKVAKNDPTFFFNQDSQLDECCLMRALLMEKTLFVV